jgi:hypothetical protein
LLARGRRTIRVVLKPGTSASVGEDSSRSEYSRDLVTQRLVRVVPASVPDRERYYGGVGVERLIEAPGCIARARAADLNIRIGVPDSTKLGNCSLVRFLNLGSGNWGSVGQDDAIPARCC